MHDELSVPATHFFVLHLMFNSLSMELLFLVPVVCLLLIQVVLLLRRTPSFGSDTGFQQIERSLRDGIESIRREQQEEFARSRQEQMQILGELRAELLGSQRENRSELANSFASFEDSRRRDVHEQQEFQRGRFSDLVAAQERIRLETAATLDTIRNTVENRLASLQEHNAAKLEEMRLTVDEKLQATLEKRLSESFRQVSERLQKVHEGLGEMKSLATGVGDLKKVLSNVKTRGVLGEMQLQNILASLLAPEQYEENVATRDGSRERVEFAVRLPGKDDDGDVVLLPIDAKFPLEAYYRLVEAGEIGDAALVKQASKEIETEIRRCAREISDKYLNPPRTTDFGILFLPVEGLFAEVVRNTALLETLQREYNIIVTGPTTLAALLNSLQMGFRTLAIQKRTSEVWKVLSQVKREFATFGDVLTRAQNKLTQASSEIDRLVGVRTRKIQHTLRSIDQDSTDELEEPEL